MNTQEKCGIVGVERWNSPGLGLQHMAMRCGMARNEPVWDHLRVRGAQPGFLPQTSQEQHPREVWPVEVLAPRPPVVRNEDRLVTMAWLPNDTPAQFLFGISLIEACGLGGEPRPCSREGNACWGNLPEEEKRN